MAVLTIKIPNSEYKKIKAYAKHAGFKRASEWARDLVEKNLALEESPRINPGKIISQMKKTGYYRTAFLHDLKKSLHYADKTA